MKKTGILTFHHANNFGAVLQAYALLQAVTAKSGDCEIINYHNGYIDNYFKNKSFKRKLINISSFFINHTHYKSEKIKYRKFNDFRNRYFKCSEQYYVSDEFCKKYDSIIVGSDQVWNPLIIRDDITYYLPYSDGARKLTYAASFGTNPDENKQMWAPVEKYLSDFEALLVREKAAADFLSGITDKKADVVADPTFLLNSGEWEKVFKPVNSVEPGKYILLYTVAAQTNAISLSKKLSEKFGLPVYFLSPGRHKYDGIINMEGIGPDEFLWLIKNAGFVVTTSYHGLILSMNLNTKFLFEVNMKDTVTTNSRMLDLMNKYGIEEYIIKSDNPEDYSELSYNWDRINVLIRKERKGSLDRLYDLLEKDNCIEGET